MYEVGEFFDCYNIRQSLQRRVLSLNCVTSTVHFSDVANCILTCTVKLLLLLLLLSHFLAMQQDVLLNHVYISCVTVVCLAPGFNSKQTVPLLS